MCCVKFASLCVDLSSVASAVYRGEKHLGKVARKVVGENAAAVFAERVCALAMFVINTMRDAHTNRFVGLSWYDSTKYKFELKKMRVIRPMRLRRG